MKGDFSRWTFDPERRYSGVLLQQGRVVLDADWNEQGAIFQHHLRSLAADLIGPHGGPQGALGFALSALELSSDHKRLSLKLGAGRYYVEGLPCVNTDGELGHDFPREADDGGAEFDGRYLAYLEVWERAVSYLEDDRLREVALGGPDTARRRRVEWRLHLREVESLPADHEAFLEAIRGGAEHRPPALEARARHDTSAADTPCSLSPEARYRGLENQLYRVEVHRGGDGGEATFKWSRENASVDFAVAEAAGAVITLESLGRDGRLGLQEGDWVEALDARALRDGRSGELARVESVERERTRVVLDRELAWEKDAGARLLRRWEQQAGDPTAKGLELEDGAAKVKEGEWQALEDGVEIRFHGDESKPGRYRSGDYWLIPARTATGDVEWPGGARPPHGVARYYAPLAGFRISRDGGVGDRKDLRRAFEALSKPVA